MIPENCPTCGSDIEYDEEYDAEYCAECNIWLAQKCTDAECEFCRDRPLKPIPDPQSP